MSILSVAQREVGSAADKGTAHKKYVEWYYGKGKTAYTPWCAIFVSWCAAQAGDGSVQKAASCDTMKSNCGNYKKSKAYGGSATPSAGDIVFFSKGHSQSDSTHVGIVASVSSSGFSTIEGNAGGKPGYVSNNNSYKFTDPYVIGYGTTNGEDETSSEEDSEEETPTIELDDFTADKSAANTASWHGINFTIDKSRSKTSTFESLDFAVTYDTEGSGTLDGVGQVNIKGRQPVNMTLTTKVFADGDSAVKRILEWSKLLGTRDYITVSGYRFGSLYTLVGVSPTDTVWDGRSFMHATAITLEFAEYITPKTQLRDNTAIAVKPSAEEKEAQKPTLRSDRVGETQGITAGSVVETSDGRQATILSIENGVANVAYFNLNDAAAGQTASVPVSELSLKEWSY